MLIVDLLIIVIVISLGLWDHGTQESYAGRDLRSRLRLEVTFQKSLANDDPVSTLEHIFHPVKPTLIFKSPYR